MKCANSRPARGCATPQSKSAGTPYRLASIFCSIPRLGAVHGACRDLRGCLGSRAALTAAALAGAEILLNLSASNITIGKAETRRLFCASQSARCIAAYAYSAAGPGESTTDLAWDGHAAIFEYGVRLAETERFSAAPTMAVADVDLACFGKNACG